MMSMGKGTKEATNNSLASIYESLQQAVSIMRNILSGINESVSKKKVDT